MVLPLIGVSRQPSTVRPFLAGDLLQNPFTEHSLLRINGKKNHSHAVFAGRGKREAQVRTFAVEEGVRNLNQNAGAIAGLRIAAASAAVRQVDQNLDALEDDIVRLLPLDVRDEADAASVMLVLRAVKSLCLGQGEERVIGFLGGSLFHRITLRAMGIAR